MLVADVHLDWLVSWWFGVSVSAPLSNDPLISLAIVALLLWIGVELRDRIQWFATARIPASLIGGAIGLAVAQHLAFWQWPEISFWKPTMDNLRQWPGTLIAVVFAGMLLAKRPRAAAADEVRRSQRWSDVGRQGLMVWIIVVGQTAVGLWVTWWLIQPWYDLPNSTGLLIETGLAGGHGTAAAMGDVFRHPIVGLEEGLDLGLLMATAGLIYGLVGGIVWVNLGIAMRWVKPSSVPRAPVIRREPVSEPNSIEEPPIRRMSLGYARVESESIDPLLLQLMWLSLAVMVGLLLQGAVGQVAGGADSWFAVTDVMVSEPLADASEAEVATQPDVSSDAASDALRKKLTWAGIVSSFPLFIYTLFGGAIVRRVLKATGRRQWIDWKTIERLVGGSMDLLIVAAVTTLDVAALAALWVPFLLLFVAGAVWSTFCLLALSRWILPEKIWFPLGIINFGMSTGTTATGFVLLRIVDPELKSGAAEDYALAAPLSAPFIGGGILTIGLPLLVLETVPIGWSATVALVVLLALIAVAVRWRGRGTV